jgi:hypothetical protein
VTGARLTKALPLCIIADHEKLKFLAGSLRYACLYESGQVRADVVIRDGSEGRRRPEATVEGTCDLLNSNHNRCSSSSTFSIRRQETRASRTEKMSCQSSDAFRASEVTNHVP